jgi:hypothetical protein
MAAKKNSDSMAFIVSQLKANPQVDYATVAERAQKKGHKIFPIMYGRAKLLLGMVKAGSGASKRKTTGRRPGRPATTGRGAGLRRAAAAAGAGGDPLNAVRDLVSAVQETQRANESLRRTLEKVKELIDRAL